VCIRATASRTEESSVTVRGFDRRTEDIGRVRSLSLAICSASGTSMLRRSIMQFSQVSTPSIFSEPQLGQTTIFLCSTVMGPPGDYERKATPALEVSTLADSRARPSGNFPGLAAIQEFFQ